MDELSKEYVISFFNKTLLIHGNRPESLRWTEEGQRKRYTYLLDIDRNIDGKKILDYGCGRGDFYQYLRERDISVNYTGFDINKRFILLAQKRYPECRFSVFDMEKDALNEDFDYIFLCGVYNLKVPGLEETIKTSLIKLFRHCRVALAFNALSAHNPQQDFELHYSYPEDICAFAVENLSPSVKIIDDALPYDFTIFIYKERKR
jgi:SAM-dependent methyltransferase